MKINRVVLCMVIFLGIALVASSAFAQGRRYPGPATRGAGQNTQHLSLAVPQAADPEQAKYTFVELDPLGQYAGFCYADAHAINNADQVVVDWSDPKDCNKLHASLWDKGKWTPLDYPVDPSCSEPATYLTSITNWGFAFGGYWSACPYEAAGGVYVKTRQWFFLPDIKGFPYNQGFSMNDYGIATGVAVDANYAVYKHWIWDGRKYLFQSFKAGWKVDDWWDGPLFINDWGQIVGQYVDIATGRSRGYLQNGSKVTTFDAPGNPSGTYVNGINNAGYAVITGAYDDEKSPYYPLTSFLLRQGKFTPLPHVPFEGVDSSVVFGVNDYGDMVGRWWDSKDNMHTYVAFRH